MDFRHIHSQDILLLLTHVTLCDLDHSALVEAPLVLSVLIVNLVASMIRSAAMEQTYFS